MSKPSAAAESTADREIVLTREIAAPARLLFAAFSQREHLMQWFGPREWPVTLCELDFRVGGRFRMQMTGPGGEKNTPFGGEYREIIPERKIVYDNGFELPGEERMVVTVTFVEERGKTTLTVHTVFASPAMKKAHEGYDVGLAECLDQLTEQVLARV